MSTLRDLNMLLFLDSDVGNLIGRIVGRFILVVEFVSRGVTMDFEAFVYAVSGRLQ